MFNWYTPDALLIPWNYLLRQKQRGCLCNLWGLCLLCILYYWCSKLQHGLAPCSYTLYLKPVFHAVDVLEHCGEGLFTARQWRKEFSRTDHHIAICRVFCSCYTSILSRVQDHLLSWKLIPSNQMNTAVLRELVGSHQLRSPAKERQTLAAVPMASKPKTSTGHKKHLLMYPNFTKSWPSIKGFHYPFIQHSRPETTINCYGQTSRWRKLVVSEKKLKGSQLLSADIHVVLWTQLKVKFQATNLSL